MTTVETEGTKKFCKTQHNRLLKQVNYHIQRGQLWPLSATEPSIVSINRQSDRRAFNGQPFSTQVFSCPRQVEPRLSARERAEAH